MAKSIDFDGFILPGRESGIDFSNWSVSRRTATSFAPHAGFMTRIRGSCARSQVSTNEQRFRLLKALIERPGVLEWLRLKAALSADLVRDWRDAVQDASDGQMELTSRHRMSTECGSIAMVI